MKYIVMLGDGMADEPIEALGGKTPLEAADTPNLDELSGKSEIGMVATIPPGMAPGSDTANLSVIGYNPEKYYTGRSPLEALSIGVPMKDTDVSLRCNLVTLSEDEDRYEDRIMIDHSSDEISTEDAAVLLRAVADELENETYRFYSGTSYRHLVIWDKGEVVNLTQPHDILGRRIAELLPLDDTLREMQKKSFDILKDHPINVKRREAGIRPANSIWLWGAGTRPALTSFYERFGKKGMMISAVDLLKGIAVGIGMDTCVVEGANGGLDTNYTGKAQAAVDAVLKGGYDLAYIHLEAPDEMGHQGSVEKKILSIENMDRKMIGLIREQMDASGEPYRLLVLPDHPTPIRLRTHVADPVPYLLYDSSAEQSHTWKYNEREAATSGHIIKRGCEIMGYFLQEPDTEN